MNALWVVAENAALAAELISGARQVGTGAEVIAFVGGDEAAAKDAIAAGADAAFCLPATDEIRWEDYASTIAAKARSEVPAVILFTASRRGRDLAAQVAGLLDAPCVSDCKSLSIANGAITASRMVFGGLAMKTMTSTAPTVLATVAAKTFDAQAADAMRNGAVATLTAAASQVKVMARRPKEAGHVNLNDATRVVGVGRGFADKSELALADALAKTLNAEVACSRPIAEFFKWMPEEAYLGISGQVIKPALYVAAGVSGQAQHMYGVRDAKIIVAVNKDENAPVLQNADYYILGDVKEVLPALTQALAGRGA